MGDKDERGQALSVNVERGAGIFCEIVIVCFLSIRYKSNGLYYMMADTPSSPTQFFIEVITPEVIELACDGQFGAQTCKIHVSGHQTCTSVHIRSHFMYTDVSMAYVAFQCARAHCHPL